MSDTKYAYAVARIRALENGLFSSAQIEQLLSVKSYEGALRFLTEHGWGDADTPLSAEAILTREKAKTWETVRDLLKGDDAILAVLLYLWLDGWQWKKWHRRALAVGLAGLYAASDEFHQLFVEGRAGSVRDVMIDTAGALIGVTVAVLCGALFRRLKRKGER